MLPKHQNPQFFREDSRGGIYQAVAPYNFVPLPEAVVDAAVDTLPGHDCYLENTGYIECTLTTATPLYTRTALRPEFFQQWGEKIREMMKENQARATYAEFFHLDDAQAPVIPGSTLRGMTRALVEIVSQSKVQWVTDEPLVFRSVGDRTELGDYYRTRLMEEKPKNWMTPKLLAGYLENHGHRWFIRPAQTIGGASFGRIHRNEFRDLLNRLGKWHNTKNAYEIWVKLGKHDFQDVQEGHRRLKYIPVLEARASATPGFQKGILACSGFMNNKRREAVFFPPDENASLIEVDEDLVRRYGEQVSQEQEKLLGAKGAMRTQQPVFYLMDDNGLVFFGHAMMFRLPYEKTPLDFVPKELRDPNRTDLAEAIFGYVAANKNDKRQARAGRVYFGDARIEQEQHDIWLSEQPITPKILSSPKPTTFQHYLTQQQPDAVDTGQRNRADKPVLARPLDHYASPPPHETAIRGTKLYWHQEKTSSTEIAEAVEPDWKKDTQHTQIKPVRAGVTFRFRIHFENLRDFEVGALLWALTLPGEDGKKYRHKLGMGKPLGMGSVEIQVQQLGLSQRAERYTQLWNGEGWHLPEEAKLAEKEAYIEQFEAYVLGSAGVRRLRDIERIKMLLRLLEWPGLPAEYTRYMELAMFRERPVLPDPLHVTRPLTRGYEQPTRSRREEAPPIAKKATDLVFTSDKRQNPGKEHQKLVERTQALLRGETVPPTGSAVEPPVGVNDVAVTPVQVLADIERGILIHATVREVLVNAVVCDIGIAGVSGTLASERIVPTVTDPEELKEKFPVGLALKLWVLGINKKGRVQLAMQRPKD